MLDKFEFTTSSVRIASAQCYRMMKNTIKLLTKKNCGSWKQLRLEALKTSPASFASSYEEESVWSDAKFQEALEKSDVFGVFIENELIACAGFYSLNSLKTQHRGVLWGMYTKPEFRCQGIASSLVEAIIIHAKNHVMQLHLTCVTINLKAIDLYQKHGFRIYGTEPCSIKIGDTFFDEHLMVLKF